MDFPDAGIHPSIEENAFREGRLTGVYVRHDADVAHMIERDGPAGGVCRSARLC